MPRVDPSHMSPEVRAQYEAAIGNNPPPMSNKERARQQYRPYQAKSVADEYRDMWRNLTPDQRSARIVSARLRDAQTTLHSHTLTEYERLTADATGARVAALLAAMIERLEPYR